MYELHSAIPASILQAMANNKNPNSSTSTGITFIILGGLLIFFGPAVFVTIIRSILAVLLHHPAENTTGLAVLNITSLLVALLCLVVGISLVIIGIARYTKSKK